MGWNGPCLLRIWVSQVNSSIVTCLGTAPWSPHSSKPVWVRNESSKILLTLKRKAESFPEWLAYSRNHHQAREWENDISFCWVSVQSPTFTPFEEGIIWLTYPRTNKMRLPHSAWVTWQQCDWHLRPDGGKAATQSYPQPAGGGVGPGRS